MMSQFLSIKEAAGYMKVSTLTRRRWEKHDTISPSYHTKSGQRRYDVSKLHPSTIISTTIKERPTIAYARVSGHDQKDDLQRQIHMLDIYCAAKGWSFSTIK